MAINNSINVKVNPQNNYTVKSVRYGIQDLKQAADLSIAGAATGDVIMYNSTTNSFAVESVSNILPDLDAGFF